MLRSQHTLRLTLFLSLAFLPLSCHEKDRFQFPYVHLNLYAGLYSDLASLGIGSFGFYFDDAGLNGLIIYRDYNDEYHVFDRTCTYEPEFNCAVVRDTANSFLLECPCCGSQYFIDQDEAYVFKGPARYSLVRYNSFIEGTNLHITN